MLQEDVGSIIQTRTKREQKIRECLIGPKCITKDFDDIASLMPVFNDLMHAAHDVSWVLRHMSRVMATLDRYPVRVCASIDWGGWGLSAHDTTSSALLHSKRRAN